jgi:hypothetical protein
VTETLASDDDSAGDSRAWQSVVPVGDSVRLPPDPHIMDSLGGNHRLETAVADLVDNCIDAGAARILIRFVVSDGKVRTFYIVDDGRGMNRDQIDSAMTVGSVRNYRATDLGHFGLGLKAASFSQADSLTVMSCNGDAAAVGRRWLQTKAKNSFLCDIVGYGFVCQELGRQWEFLTPKNRGTIIRWDDIRTFPSAADTEITTRFINDCITRLQHHLGLVFHRFLADGRVVIGIDVEDADVAETGPVTEIEPIDPFAYGRPGATGYPKNLTAQIYGTSLDAACHVWPGRSQLPQFRLNDKTTEQSQGFYFYRHDRLLQAGGWNNVEVPRRDLQLARVCIELNDTLVDSRVFRMNPEKSRIECGHEFSSAIAAATAEGGVTFNEYLNVARSTAKESNQRTRKRAAIVPLGRGVPPRVRRTVQQELIEIPGYDEIDVRWCDFHDDVLFDVDRQDHTIWLNQKYRRAITSGPGRFNDAPLVKTMLFLLVESMFHGAWLGPKERDNLDLWQTLLTAAAKEQQ